MVRCYMFQSGQTAWYSFICCKLFQHLQQPGGSTLVRSHNCRSLAWYHIKPGWPGSRKRNTYTGECLKRRLRSRT
eukprot:6687645-Pyramimonas_sp.AAC.1